MCGRIHLRGTVRFSTGLIRDGRGDRFWALALALHAAQNFQPEGEVVVANERFLFRIVT
ncbi:MAG: hypothetical protein LBQ03_00045 [Puniceicoccales bacterium]|nr:hypothetical protein [Puniceicoccales bacterium]